jgi:hypothetical protein
MPDPNLAELIFSILTVRLRATGAVAKLLAVPIAIVLLAVAWRIVSG